MNQTSIGADDDRILLYARLIEPDIWQEYPGRLVSRDVRARLRRSLEAAYRIAEQVGGVSDPTDVVARLSLAHGLDDHDRTVGLPGDMDADMAAGLVAILLSGGVGSPDDTDVGGDEGGADSTSSTPETGPLPGEQDDDAEDGQCGDVLPEDEPVDESDPDHDPESGISHVGDADEGQHHEEE